LHVIHFHSGKSAKMNFLIYQMSRNTKSRKTPLWLASRLYHRVKREIYTTYDLTLNYPTCPICMDDSEELGYVSKRKGCNHYFHRECLEEWYRHSNTCPLCRREEGESTIRKILLGEPVKMINP